MKTSTTSERVTHLRIPVPAITRGTLARTHELKMAVFSGCEQRFDHKGVSGDQKNAVRNSFVIEHSYAYQLRNIKRGDTMAYYQNRRSPWFDQLPKARRWLEEQEENRIQGENRDRPNRK